MSEKLPPIEKPRSELPIEQQANFEGSWTNLMCERLQNPEIRKQVIDLLVELDRDPKNALYDDAGKKESDNSPYYDPRTREQIEKEYDEKIENIQKYTPISFGAEQPNAGGEVGEEEQKLKKEEKYDKKREVLNLNWIFPLSNEKLSEKQLNIAESHEKGHVVREYNTLDFVSGRYFYLGKKFWKAFDFLSMKYPDEFCDLVKKEIEKEEGSKGSEKTNEEIREELLGYLKSPSELAERMSQLKNYFGMADDKLFTKEHLAYAREYYIKDTDMDNVMTQFFQAITPEKEDAFIELINSAGI